MQQQLSSSANGAALAAIVFMTSLAACQALRGPVALPAATWTASRHSHTACRAPAQQRHILYAAQQSALCGRSRVRQLTAAAAAASAADDMHAPYDCEHDDSEAEQQTGVRRRVRRRTCSPTLVHGAASTATAAAAAAAPRYSALDYEEASQQYTTSKQQHTSSAAVDVSLDATVMPRPVHPALVSSAAVLLLLAAIAVAARIPLLLGALGRGVGSVWAAGAEVARRLNIGGAIENARYSARLALGSAQAWLDDVRASFDRQFGPEEIVLPVDDWSVCTLHERARAGPNCLKYTFRLPGPAFRLPLELGQALTLCGLDATGRVASASFIPLSPRYSHGYFEIVLQKDRDAPLSPSTSSGSAGSSLSSSVSLDFTRLLDALAIGDEVAVRPGRTALQYRGPYSPITDVVLVASGLGIVPMLQMVRELLPSRDSSVKTASVIWLNERAEDFCLYSDLEKEFYKHHRKLDVACIIERDLFGHALAANRKVREAVPAFKIGTLAAVSGPDYFVTKVRDYLTKQGYPDEVILSV